MKNKVFYGKLKRKMGKVSDIMMSEETDPNGSYTGFVTDEGYEVPVQDADDL